MNVIDIIGALKTFRVVPQYDGNQLKLIGETNALPTYLIEQVKTYKTEIIRLLSVIKEDAFPVTTKNNNDFFPVSNAQKRIWLLSQSVSASRSYQIVTGIHLNGALDINLLTEALQMLVKRHESLRTTFKVINGEIKQIINNNIDFFPTVKELPIEKNSIEWLKEELAIFNNFVIDIENGPLYFPFIYKLSSTENVLLFVVHHLVTDERSIGVMLKDVLIAYSSQLTGKNILPAKASLQVKDCVSWQEKIWKENENTFKTFWKNYVIEDLEPLNLPYIQARSSILTFLGHKITQQSMGYTFDELNVFCKKSNVTPFNFFRAVIHIFLYKITGQKDTAVGIPVMERSHTILEDQVGLFVNTLPLFYKLNPSQSFEMVIKAVASDTAMVLAFKDYPFDQIIENVNVHQDRSRNPLFDVMLVYQDVYLEENIASLGEAANVTIAPLENILEQEKTISTYDCGAQFDLTFIFGSRHASGGFITVNYNSALFDEPQIINFIDIINYLISQIIKSPYQTVETYDIVTSEIQKRILNNFNDTQHPVSKLNLIELFQNQSNINPYNIAIIENDNALEYGQLNKRVNQFARFLKENYHLTPGNIVALRLSRGIGLVTAILGVLKIGGAYLPIEPDFPEARIDYMIEDSGCEIVINDEIIKKFIESAHLYLDTNLSHTINPDDLAYVIYTSGSTGKPKGCMIEHRSLLNRLDWMWQVLGFNVKDVILQKTTHTFDVSVWELLLPVCWGAKMVIAHNDDILSSMRLIQLIDKYEVTCLHFVPSVFNVFLSDIFDKTANYIRLKSLRRVITSGEALTSETVKKWHVISDVPLYNLYGPTEATIDSTYHKVCLCNEKIPIGKPIWNTQILILDNHKRLQPIGIPGEIYIGGTGVGRGYINNYLLSQERFISNPYLTNGRLYKTGDMGRWLPNGTLEYLGRKDDQVKVKGIRIEINEIQKALICFPGIKDAFVAVKENSQGLLALNAYLVTEQIVDVLSIRNFLNRTLPIYMLPENFFCLDRLPLTVSGKVDREVLLAMDNKIGTTKPYCVPENETERQLVIIWQELLGHHSIGTGDSFYELGGDSLKGMVLLKRISDYFEVSLVPADFHGNPTIRSLAIRLNEISWLKSDQIWNNEISL